MSAHEHPRGCGGQWSVPFLTGGCLWHTCRSHAGGGHVCPCGARSETVDPGTERRPADLGGPSRPPSYAEQDPVYRQAMRDAGRAELLP